MICFFRLFLLKTIKIAKKKITQIFPYICSARGAINLQL